MAAVQEVDFAVAGCGVVGTACALVLAQAGFKVALVGRRLAPFVPGHEQAYDPRVFAITAASQRLLTRLKVWDKLPHERVQQVREMRICAVSGDGGAGHGAGHSFGNGLGLGALHFDAVEAGSQQLTWIVEQSVLFEGLFQAVQYHPNVQVLESNTLCLTDDTVQHFGAQDAAGHGVGTAGVLLGVQLDDVLVKAAMVVDATGANSPLVQQLGISKHWRPYGYSAVVCHVTVAKPHRGVARQWFVDGTVLALLPMPGQVVSVVWSMPAHKAQQILQAPVPGQELLQQLAALPQVHNAMGDAALAGEPFGFELRHGVASTWVWPGLMLMGDAAHVVHPLAGQGLNLGLEDVEHLAFVMSQHQAELYAMRQNQAQALQKSSIWARWARQRKAACMQVYGLTHALHLAVAAQQPVVNALMGMSFGVLNRLPMAKRLLMRSAMR